MTYSGWSTFCLGDAFWKRVVEVRKANESDESESELVGEESEKKPDKSFASETGSGHQPLLHIISQLRQVVIVRLLEYHVDWAEVTEEVTPEQAVWIYSLMGSVEKPLHPDVESSLRSLVLICSKQRSVIIASNLTPDAICHLNLIICLVAKYFGQADLADN